MLVVEKTLQHIQRAGNDDVAYSINLHKSTLNDESCHRTIQELMDLYKIRT